MSRPFLTAEWCHLLMLNYEVPRELIEPLVPPGIELDLWQGRCLVSVVGFQFLKTRVLGVAVPWHCNFPEVNLRFYTKRRVDGEWRRGVTFICEIAPRIAIEKIARWVFNENYATRRMRADVRMPDGAIEGHVAYSWREGPGDVTLSAHIAGKPAPLVEGSEAQFISEHYWGYSINRRGRGIEYEVRHPVWGIWKAQDATLSGPIEEAYGREFAECLSKPPTSAFVADGSAVAVYRGNEIARIGPCVG